MYQQLMMGIINASAPGRSLMYFALGHRKHQLEVLPPSLAFIRVTLLVFIVSNRKHLFKLLTGAQVRDLSLFKSPLLSSQSPVAVIPSFHYRRFHQICPGSAR